MRKPSSSLEVELASMILKELEAIPFRRGATVLHGSRSNQRSRPDSDFDLLILAREADRPHHRIVHVSESGLVLDVNVFHPKLLLRAIEGQYLRGERTLAAIVAKGLWIEEHDDLSFLFELADTKYHGSPPQFPFQEYACKLSSIFSKISHAPGDKRNRVLVSEAYALIATSILWAAGQWVCSSVFLTRALKSYDEEVFERLDKAFLRDFLECRCERMFDIAVELFSTFGGLKHYTHDSVFL